MKKVFLGGTCNGSTWREELIPMLKVPYFNGNAKYHKDSNGHEDWHDEEENLIHEKFSDGEEYYYDKEGEVIDAKTSSTKTN